MTRALQTAAVVAARLVVPLRVELDLREWLPDETYGWTTPGEVMTAYEDMVAHGGTRPNDHHFQWEPMTAVKSRAEGVLRPHLIGGPSVLAVCHEVLIHALTGHPRTPHAGMRIFEGC
jgi:uncharacterized phosphatase